LRKRLHHGRQDRPRPRRGEEVAPSFPGSAWERTAGEAPPRESWRAQCHDFASVRPAPSRRGPQQSRAYSTVKGARLCWAGLRENLSPTEAKSWLSLRRDTHTRRSLASSGFPGGAWEPVWVETSWDILRRHSHIS